MVHFIYLKKILLLILLSLFFLSCENTGDKQSLKQIAITLIANYADGSGNAPTIRNYEDAGIIGVNERNIDELNSFIATLNKENIDTEEELNAVIDGLGVSLASDIFGPVITIHGPNPLTLHLGDTYKKVCADAIDNHDGPVTVYVKGEVNTKKVGTYIVTYSAVDEAGNVTSVNRVIHVIDVVKKPNYHIHIVSPNVGYSLGITVTLNSQETMSIPTIATTTSTFTTTLTEGEHYSIALLDEFGICEFKGYGFSLDYTAIKATGIIGTSDVTLDILCHQGG
jgi:hypothetical protein